MGVGGCLLLPSLHLVGSLICRGSGDAHTLSCLLNPLSFLHSLKETPIRVHYFFPVRRSDWPSRSQQGSQSLSTSKSIAWTCIQVTIPETWSVSPQTQENTLHDNPFLPTKEPRASRQRGYIPRPGTFRHSLTTAGRRLVGTLLALLWVSKRGGGKVGVSLLFSPLGLCHLKHWPCPNQTDTGPLDTIAQPPTPRLRPTLDKSLSGA